ncbi:TetR family transcriptional regulator [Streptomyces sp. AS58]|uniref:TetR/AcrR family transcriptional regulator n=1 Tax=Streptomyces sp. AS58 TaxID=1519489 RepID=UPI0006C30949|nr:TetR/AcrR family transcriptional regulator [Streptomyces sp. AS58]KOV71842.1 TetR family transcriptional regulator [Streptomyces sp. AS58]
MVPKLWTETIDAHRAAVRTAVLDTTAALVAEHGLTAVTMSRIAKDSGIGRATLYKYFPDVEAILLAWHERQVRHHLEHLSHVRDQSTAAGQRLETVLIAFALLTHDTRSHHDSDLAAVLHHGAHAAQAREQLHRLIEDLLADGARNGIVRSDVPPGELADYCLSALTAAGDLPSTAAVHRLVTVTLAGVNAAAATDAEPAPGTDAPAHPPHRRGHGPHGRE